MPKTTSRGTAKKSELPSTLQKSSAKAQRTFAKVHDAAVKEYGRVLVKPFGAPAGTIEK